MNYSRVEDQVRCVISRSLNTTEYSKEKGDIEASKFQLCFMFVNSKIHQPPKKLGGKLAYYISQSFSDYNYTITIKTNRERDRGK